MTDKDFFNLMQIVIDDNSHKGFCELNTPHAESYTENRDLYYLGVDWVDLYVREKKVFKNFFKRLLNLKNLILSYIEPSPLKRTLRYLSYSIKNHELTHNFFVSVSDISVIKREMADEEARFIIFEEIYGNKLYEESKPTTLSREEIEKAKDLDELRDQIFNKISDDEVRKKLEQESMHYFDGVYIFKDWNNWVIDSSVVPFDMQTGWSFNKLSEIISTFLTSLLHHGISVKISNK